MQDSKSAMWISIMTNVFNIVASLVCVFLLKMGFVGIAVGTLAGEWLGLLYAALTVQRKFPRLNGVLDWRRVWRFKGAGRYFKVSRDIFLRSFLLMTVSLAFVSIGARSGDLILAVNALILQLFTLYSHFMDGIAFAGEAVVGKYYGMRDMGRMRRCVRLLFGWGLAVAAVFTLVYSFPRVAFWLLTDQQSVIEAAMDYRVWCALIPAAGMAAFVWDGVFISLTRSMGMLISAGIAWSLFFVIYWLTPEAWGNNRLWIAYLSFLALRGIIQTILYRGYLVHGVLER
jgi:MATE family multidrug resistance protein